MKSWKRTLLNLVSLSGLAAGILAGFSCGRPDDAKVDPTQQGGTGYIPVDGFAAYGTQCPYGDIDAIKPLRMQMWNCPISSTRVHLNDDIAPLYLQADCKGRVLTIRTLDRKIDASWYFLPDGEFDVVVDGLTAKLQSDSGGVNGCNAPLAVNLFGKVECGSSESTLDKATIHFQSVMWAGKRLNSRGNSPVVQPSPLPSGLAPPPLERGVVQNPCNLPASCYLYTQTDLMQCR